MKTGKSAQTYFSAASYALKLISRNQIAKICLIPIFLMSIIEANFGIFVLQVIADIQSYLGGNRGRHTINSLVLRYAALPLCHYLLELINNIMIHLTIQSVIRQSFTVLTNDYLSMNYEKYHNMGSGQIHSLIQRRTSAISSFFEVLICKVFKSVCFIVIAFIKIKTKVDNDVFWANMLIFTIYLISVHFVLNLRAILRMKQNEARNKVSNKSFSTLVNYDIIKAYNREDLELDNMNGVLSSLEYTGSTFQIITSFTGFFQKISVVIPNALIILLAFKDIYFTRLTSFQVYVFYNGLFLSLKSAIGNITTDLMVTSQHLTDLADSRIEDESKDDEGKGQVIEKFNNSIEFRNVSLRINENLFFANVNFEIKKGEKIAIIGKNGTGKSSLINILLRFRECGGQVYIDGIDSKYIKKSSQRNLISYVAQNTYISDGTVIKNLEYGNPGLKHEAIKELCVNYGTHECFSNMCDGYTTEVGEMGKFLSGGQKQRISFMRGVIKNADIFIFDEPTSNMDKKTETEIVSYIFTLLKDKTSIIILHSHEHLRKFDKILGFHNQTIKVYEGYEDYLKDSDLY